MSPPPRTPLKRVSLGPHSRGATRAHTHTGHRVTLTHPAAFGHLPSTAPTAGQTPAPTANAHRSDTPLLRLGARLNVRASGYVRSSIPQGVWKDTLEGAEDEAMRLANDYLVRARNHARALLPEYHARAQAHYDWDTAMETFSMLTDEEDLG